MTYSEAIGELITVYGGLPSNYVLKGAFWAAIGNLNSEEGSGGSDADLQVCDEVYNAYHTLNFQLALNVISETVNPDKSYPTQPVH